MNAKNNLAKIASKWIEGTTLQGAKIEILNYLEDDVWIVALDFIGKPCDEAAFRKIVAGMEILGLRNIQRVNESVIATTDGLRVYSDAGKQSLQELLETQKENDMDEFFSKVKCDRCGTAFGDGTRTLSRFNKQVICKACSNEERERPDYSAAVEAELAEIKKGNREFDGPGL